MKSKLLIACSVAVSMASCSKKETTDAPADTPAEKPAVVEEVVEEIVPEVVVPTKVAAGLKGLTYTLEGDKFVNQEVSNDTEYFLVYFSASW